VLELLGLDLLGDFVERGEGRGVWRRFVAEAFLER
jgi:hypothetical protein